MIHIKAKNANQIWIDFAKKLSIESSSQSDSRLGLISEILHASFTIENPRQRWVFARQPSINPAFALAEIVWIINGSNEADFLNFWNPILPKYAGSTSTYHGAYGYRLRKQFGFDQLHKAYLALSNNNTSRQVVLQIWDSTVDFPDALGQPVAKDIPCNLCSILKVRNHKLEWMQIMRSNDFNRGLPYNIVQFTTLQEILAGWLGIEIGTYNHLSDSLHFYTLDLDKFSHSSNTKLPFNKDDLRLSKKESEQSFRTLYKKMEQMKSPKITKDIFLELFDYPILNQAIHNILLVVGADAARRKKWYELSEHLMQDCTNPVFKYLWNNWVKNKIMST